MAGYIGPSPPNRILSSADIADNSITGAKIVAGTIASLAAAASTASPTFTGTTNVASCVTLPAGHVVQTVYATSTSHTTTTTTGTSINATHLTKDIQITAGNTIRWTFNFAHNTLATDASANTACKWYMYHKEDSGSFADIYSGDYVGSHYNDENGKLPAYASLTVNNCFTGIHTPSSGTHHHYKLYYKFELGWYFDMGIASGVNQQHVILEEIQA